MFFRREVCLKKLNALQAVANGRTAYLLKSLKSMNPSHNGRTSRCIPVGKRGSMTVEAALVFPIFLLVVTAFVYLLFLTQLKTEVGRALTDSGKELSQAAVYSEQAGGMGSTAAVILHSRRQVQKYLDGKAAAVIVKGGRESISVLGSSWEEETSLIKVRASYQVVLPPGILWFEPLKIVQEKTVRGWTGFEKRESGRDGEGEEIVYVTDYGTVYHRDIGCRYLKLSIQHCDRGEIDGLRNESGGKYYPCERCWKDGADILFYTEDGTRYHQSLNCSSLIRGIRTILLSETTLPPCSVCGG